MKYKKIVILLISIHLCSFGMKKPSTQEESHTQPKNKLFIFYALNKKKKDAFEELEKIQRNYGSKTSRLSPEQKKKLKETDSQEKKARKEIDIFFKKLQKSIKEKAIEEKTVKLSDMCAEFRIEPKDYIVGHYSPEVTNYEYHLLCATCKRFGCFSDRDFGGKPFPMPDHNDEEIKNLLGQLPFFEKIVTEQEIEELSHPYIPSEIGYVFKKETEHINDLFQTLKDEDQNEKE